MKVVERLPLTAQHSLYLVEIEGGTLLVATSPAGCAILDRPPQSVRDGSKGR